MCITKYSKFLTMMTNISICSTTQPNDSIDFNSLNSPIRNNKKKDTK